MELVRPDGPHQGQGHAGPHQTPPHQQVGETRSQGEEEGPKACDKKKGEKHPARAVSVQEASQGELAQGEGQVEGGGQASQGRRGEPKVPDQGIGQHGVGGAQQVGEGVAQGVGQEPRT